MRWKTAGRLHPAACACASTVERPRTSADMYAQTSASPSSRMDCSSMADLPARSWPMQSGCRRHRSERRDLAAEAKPGSLHSSRHSSPGFEPLAHQGVHDVHWPAAVDVMRTGEDGSIPLTSPAGRTGGLQRLDCTPRTLRRTASIVRGQRRCGLSSATSRTTPAADGIHFTDARRPEARSLPGTAAPRICRIRRRRLAAGCGPLTLRRPPSLSIRAAVVTDTLTGLVKTRSSHTLPLRRFLLSLLLGSLHASRRHGSIGGAYLVGRRADT